ncbi:NAD(P) transhydrogenase subunit alpha [Porphyromonas levii]|uniref:proton-translocating NAD(P)(+) transhydrogenase n=1 Tax=Porphyromonas levii TaxID=28114 RepID=A0A4Y8WSL8_9PORP|nr:NAD(P) transhydrogenase subunit alpha [Porphyromonas levii]MBR8730280.1 NAD(P) transhydrogenase subunit alpha [Porphyromonas levii]MBR8731585.1 NAD(P) transhydrogenase subunit alpha [Porphyromonas levii]MBR8759313.1 NAD(P) transhydrogenase subunit alpha [Porphyromonas levii]MBR8764337.1 NAD(P) transhydrogenase subunit alpha [Porphyromonas levii]TFH96552.1 NAD(P) transhydrogenase subunit alpha [Porphyromonas levii]
MTNPIVLVLVFIVSSLVGYFVIKKIPSLLHTPLMSGMNALSGITVIGAIIVLVLSMGMRNNALIIIAGLAIVLAMINVVGGFGVTERMLRMFRSNKKKGGES